MKAIFVLWQDHHSFDRNVWHDPEDLDDIKPLEVKTLGWLIKENKDHVIVAGHLCTEGPFCGEMMILKKNILKRKFVNVG